MIGASVWRAIRFFQITILAFRRLKKQVLLTIFAFFFIIIAVVVAFYICGPIPSPSRGAGQAAGFAPHQSLWPLRLVVRTTGFQSVNRGPIPLGATRKNEAFLSLVFLYLWGWLELFIS